MSVDLDGPEPIYQQIAAVLRAGIHDGTYPPRRRLPSEADLVAEYGVSRKTARSAIGVLVAEGLAITSQGKGTFVAER